MEVGSRRRNMALCNILRLLLSSIAIVFSCYSGYIEGSSIRLQAEERLRREAVPPLFGTEVCIGVLDSILKRPLFSASLRLPGPVVSNPSAPMFPIDKLLRNITGTYYDVEPATHFDPITRLLAPMSGRVYGFECPVGQFLVLVEANRTCTYLECGTFNYLLGNDSSDSDIFSTREVIDIDLSPLLLGYSVNMACSEGFAVTSMINSEVCAINGLLRACVTIHCRRYPFERDGSEIPPLPRLKTRTSLEALELGMPGAFSFGLIINALGVARDISSYFSNAAIVITEQNDILTRALNMVDQDTLKKSNGVFSTSQLLFMASTQVVEALEVFGMLYPPLDSLFVTFATPEISQTLIDVIDDSPGIGLQYAIYPNNSASHGSVDLAAARHSAITYRGSSTPVPGKKNKDGMSVFMEVELSSAVLQISGCHVFGAGMGSGNCTRRVQMNVFDQSSFFETSVAARAKDSVRGVINAPVLGIVVNERVSVQLHDEDTAVLMRFTPYRLPTTEEVHTCVFWDYAINSGLGGWNGTGCHLMEDIGTQVTCRCSHLTNFAILLTPNIVETQALTLVTYIGCGVSIVGVLLTIIIQITAIKSLDHGDIFYIQRYQQHTILIGLCIQLVFEYAGFIIAVNFSPKMPACWAGLVSLHYFALSMFAWTALEGYCLFRQVVRVANKPLVHFHKKAILFTQGLPAVIVGTAIASVQYSYMDKDRCRIKPGLVFYLSFLVPISAAILYNTIVFISVQITLYKVSRSISKDKQKLGRSFHRCWAAIGIFFILGLGWLPGYALVFFCAPPTALQWAFGLLVAFQGLFIFMSHVKGEVNMIRRRASSASLRISAKRNATEKKGSPNPEKRTSGCDSESSMPDAHVKIPRLRSISTLMSLFSVSVDQTSSARDTPEGNTRPRVSTDVSEETARSDDNFIREAANEVFDDSSVESILAQPKLAPQRRSIYVLTSKDSSSLDSNSSRKQMVSDK